VVHHSPPPHHDVGKFALPPVFLRRRDHVTHFRPSIPARWRAGECDVPGIFVNDRPCPESTFSPVCHSPPSSTRPRDAPATSTTAPRQARAPHAGGRLRRPPRRRDGDGGRAFIDSLGGFSNPRLLIRWRSRRLPAGCEERLRRSAAEELIFAGSLGCIETVSGLVRYRVTDANGRLLRQRFSGYQPRFHRCRQGHPSTLPPQ
jgi:hypothetical protein